MQVNANRFDRLWEDCRDDYLSAVDRVGGSGWYILGSEVEAFEVAFADYCGKAAAVGCASGLDAIEIALRLKGVGEGSKVLTSPLSAFATALGILRAGAIPVFCDVDQHGLMDLAAAEAAFADHPDIQAIVPVHLYGHLADLSGLGRLAERYGVEVIEDAAQAVGAQRDGLSVGANQNVACFSFYPTKNLGVLGDGGALVLPESAAAEARSIRNYGQRERYVHDVVGLNSRLDELHAATLHSVFLPRLPNWLSARRSIAARYLRGITSDYVSLCPGPDPLGSGWHLFPIRVEAARRESFMTYLADAGVQAGIHYPVLISEQRALLSLGAPLISDDLETARLFAATEVSLPINPYLTLAEADHVIETVNEWGG